MKVLSTIWNELGLKRWFYFGLTVAIPVLIGFGILLLISGCTMSPVMTMNPINPSMNKATNNIACPVESGFSGNCVLETGNIGVEKSCEYMTDTTKPEKITIWAIQDNVTLNGQPLTTNAKYTFDYSGGSADHFVCILDFEATPNHVVNFEIIKQK